jgi:hypothetical protein
MSRISKVTCACLAVMFCLFLSVQFNDVDAGIWILAYGAAAIVCLASILRSLATIIRRLSLILALGYGLWALMLAFQTSGHWWDGEIEREVGGLVISALSMWLVNYFTRGASRFT